MSANTELAVFLRQVVWLLDDVARDVPTLTAAKWAEVAGILQAVADLIRSTVDRAEPLDEEPFALSPADGDDYVAAHELRGQIAEIFGYPSYESTVLSNEGGTQVGVYLRDLRVLLDLATHH